MKPDVVVEEESTMIFRYKIVFYKNETSPRYVYLGYIPIDVKGVGSG